MNFIAQLTNIQYALNAMAAVACLLLCAEYLFIVHIRKPPYPWSSYAVSFVLFTLACDRLLKISQPHVTFSAWQLAAQCLLDSILLLAAMMIPFVRRSTYKRAGFSQLQEIHASLSYSQNLLRSYLDEAPLVSYIKDKDKKVTHANAGFVKFFGGSLESAIGKTNLWGDPVASEARDLQILAGQGDKEITQTVALEDSERTILDIRFPLLGPDSEKMLGGIAIDLTNQLKTKNRIEVFASIVELAPDAIYSHNEAGIVLTWNPAAESLFGYTQAEMIGQSVNNLATDENYDELANMVESFRLSPNQSQHFESVRVTAKGQRKAVLVEAACVPGDELTIAIITRDVSVKKALDVKIRALHDELDEKVCELSRTNISLQKARDQALESASTKSAFVANISHELRTPLSGILGLSELLARESLDQDSQNLVAMLNESAHELLQVVEDVLDLAKLEAGKAYIEEEIFSLRDLIDDCGKLFAAAMSSKSLTCKTHVDHDVPVLIRSDQSIIRQILCNMVANAVRFTESGVITMSVSIVGSSDMRQRLRFSVSDTGVGITEDHLSRLFTPFARVSQSPEGVPGTGLGLTLCKQLIDLMDGQIGCNSSKNEGSTFWFEITVGTGDAEQPTRDQETIEEQNKSEQNKSEQNRKQNKDLALPPLLPSQLERYRVLSVDDSPVVSRLTMRQLAIIGVQCESAATGREAVEKVANAFFDLILMDVHLPDMTGYEAAYQIRMQQRSRGEKESAIIALTGCTADALREPADAECMDDFLEKPVSIEQLRTCLLKVFHRALGDE